MKGIVYQLLCKNFLFSFGFLVKMIMNKETQETPFTVKVLRAFVFYSLYLSLNYMFFTQIITVIKVKECKDQELKQPGPKFIPKNVVKVSQRIPHNLTVTAMA